MPIIIECDNCGARHRLADDQAGATHDCRCGHAIRVPEASHGASTMTPLIIGRDEAEGVNRSGLRFRSRLSMSTLGPMTTMADVAFLLIIFFMLTSTFARDTGLDIKLPRAMSSEQLPKREVTVWVNQAGQIRINENWVRPIDLAAVLKQELAKTSLKAVTIRGDEHVPYGTIVTVMDTAKLLGADITLAAEAEMQGPGAPLGSQPAGGRSR